ncbi:MAG: transposase [Deltaproteobacteria bacterium]|nr:transposase [Deltaproteobacteria bacterium]
MIRHDDHLLQQSLPGLEKFDGFPLDMSNRWVELSKIIPWAEFAKAYDKSPGVGRPARAERLVVGAALIKHKLCLGDEETVSQIQENPYLQYFVGFNSLQSPVCPLLVC